MAEVGLTGLALTAVAAVVLLKLAQAFREWLLMYVALRRQMPMPRGHWLLGHLKAAEALYHHRVFRQWTDQHGGVFHVRILWVNVVVVSDPAITTAVLNNKGAFFDKNSGNVYNVFDFMTSPQRRPGLFSAHTDEHWRLVRKGIAPAFNPRLIRNGFAHVLDVNRQLADVLRNTGTAAVDIDNLAQRESLDVIGRVGFDKDFHAVRSFGASKADDVDVIGVIKGGLMEVEQRWNNPLRKGLLRNLLPSARAGAQYFTRFQAIMANLLAEVRARGEPATTDTSIAAHLMRIRDPKTGRGLSDEELLPEFGILFIAGFETTGHTIAFTLFLIATHPEVEARVAAELDELGLLVTPARPAPRQLTYDDLGKLTYLSCAIKEAMRVLPVAADGTARKVGPAAVTVEGVRLPAGCNLWFPFYATHNSSRFWDAPDEYRPERWAEPGVEYMPASPASKAAGNGASPGQAGSRHSDGDDDGADGGKAGAADSIKARRFLPFGDGVRNCVGQSLAKMNYTATLALLLSQFTFRLADDMGGPEGVRASEKNVLTLQPANGLRMHATPRLAAV